MAYLCMSCLQVYKDNLKHCPKADCYGKVEEIDELMLPIIKTLNEKGYKTDFCCSGHVYENKFGSCPYILLNDSIYEGSYDKYSKIRTLFEQAPFPWELSPYDSSLKIHLHCYCDSKDALLRYKFFNESNQKLLFFVSNLPDFKDVLKDETDER